MSAIQAHAPDHGFAFTTATGEPLQGTVVYKYHWRPILERLGLPPVPLHDLRHSTATPCLETITADVYSHILPAYRRQAADVLAAHLARGSTEQVQEGGPAL